MKKFFIALLSFILIMSCICISACGNSGSGGTQQEGSSDDEKEEENKTPSEAWDILIAYFSCTNTVKGLAEKVQAATRGTLYRIEAKVPYTQADLQYYTGCRADEENADPSARPEIGSEEIANFGDYGTVIIGYPIWYGKAPKIIYTFLESYDFSGKTIIPFCTSASSPMGSSATNLHSLTDGANWLSGTRFDRNASESTFTAWVESLNLKREEPVESNTLYIKVNGTTLTATLAENAATAELKERLKSAPLTVEMWDNDFEKVGSFGFNLPTSNEQITAQPCEFLLYNGNQLVLFYGSNAWSYTRLGKIENTTQSELMQILGDGDVTVVLSLTK